MESQENQDLRAIVDKLAEEISVQEDQIEWLQKRLEQLEPKTIDDKERKSIVHKNIIHCLAHVINVRVWVAANKLEPGVCRSRAIQDAKLTVKDIEELISKLKINPNSEEQPKQADRSLVFSLALPEYNLMLRILIEDVKGWAQGTNPWIRSKNLLEKLVKQKADQE